MNIKSNLMNKEFTIKFNWINILVAFFFYNYSFYGVGTKFESTLYKILFEILLFIILSLFYFTSKINKNRFNDHFRISLKEIGGGLLIFILILVFIGFKYFSISIIGDSFAHSYGSLYHSSYVSYIIYEQLKIPFKIGYLIFILNWIILIFFYFIFKTLILNRNTFKYILFVIIFFLIRLIFYKLGCINNFHPPGRYLFLYLSTLFSGITSTSFRLPQIVFLTLIFYYLYNFSKQYFDNFISILISLCFITIPANLYSSYIVEQSIYTSFILIFVLIEIQKTFDKINFVRLFVITSIFILIRQPILGVFLYLMPIYHWLGARNYISIDYRIYFYPSLLVIPFYFSIIFIGNPAYNIENGEHPLIQNILIFIESNIYLQSSFNHIYIYIFFIPLFFLFFNKLQFIYILFLIITLEFFSIRPVLWGIGRYQVEYTLPFVFFGMVYFFNLLNQHKKLSASLLLILIISNIIIFENIYSINRYLNSTSKNYFSDIKKPFKNFIISDFPIPINEALILFKSNHPKDKIVLHKINNINKVMPLILNNYRLDIVVDSKKDNINNLNLNYILTEAKFLNNDWILESEIRNKYNFGSLYILKKNNNSFLKE